MYNSYINSEIPNTHNEMKQTFKHFKSKLICETDFPAVRYSALHQ